MIARSLKVRQFVLASVVLLGIPALGWAQAYPVKRSASGRYLVDQNNSPFLIAGDAPQSLTVNLSTTDADSYFADRAAHAFNSVWINLICTSYTGGRADGSTYDGILPFTGFLPGGSSLDFYDLSKPNEAFFARCDQMISLAAQHGLLVFLDPAETGGWISCLVHNGAAACRAYGQFLGSRYGSFKNIVWLSGNDFQNWRDQTQDGPATAVALGIKDKDANHIHTVELDYLVSNSTDDPNWVPIIGLNASYSYFPTYAEVLAGYNDANVFPVFLVEANYEFENNTGGPVTTNALILRMQEYWTNLSGATGQIYGNHFTWTFASGWQSNLDTPGALQMANLQNLFTSRPWYNLVPDQNHSVLTAGYGTFSSSGEVSANDYAAAARTPDGTLAMAYLPTLRTVTVAMSQLGSTVSARWYDPAGGTFTAISGSPFPNSGSRTFTPPGANSEGSPDWVLVLEANPLTPIAPTITIPPSSQTVTAGQTATFTVSASGTAPLGFQWQSQPLGSTTWTNVGSDSPTYTTPPTALAQNGTSFRVVVSNAVGGVTSSVAVLSIQSGTPPGSLPSPWQSMDIGSVGLAGQSSATGGTFSVCGAGADIWNAPDAFQFAFQTLTGDGSITARIVSQTNTNPWAKAGVMIRASLDPSAAFADMVLTPGNGTAFQWRGATGGGVTSAGPNLAPPCWVRIARTGNTLTGSVSADGVSWTTVGSTSIPMASADIGLAVTSHDATALSWATIDSVSGTGAWGSGSAGPGGSGAGSGSSHGSCGLTGLELLASALVAKVIGRRRRSLSPAVPSP